MPQFDQYLLITLVLTTSTVFGFFYFFFLNKFIYPIKQVIEMRKRLKSLIKQKQLKHEKHDADIDFFQEHLKRISEKQSKDASK